MSYEKLVKPTKAMVYWEKIKLLAFDCDGVLTDGRIIYDSAGGESKNFSAQDGLGFMLLWGTDIQTAVITGRESDLLKRRCQDLRISHLFQKIPNKLQIAQGLLKELGLGFNNMLFMGDDWNDIPLMNRAAVSVCPANAPESVKALCDVVTKAKGGHGAVRECIEYVLTRKGIFEEAVLKYLARLS
ncbi:MAG: HAD hydrolase family protein [Candidatus Cloacimonadaceae bacterium]|jgi:3-deoxy-D-manno-octulosonate 8-phosphate phosphatase (KDO 8-P phosphatase)|nr:HAD hydrolase family protein [Candidatus Cloacimonadota bacterium]MDX9949309.1 HAD hydrolase family protein [Candidatus Syntrophosphaera sp.]NLN84827.1 HAD hydrolase family protein [Candidatus Cloacimonadota bacterium]